VEGTFVDPARLALLEEIADAARDLPSENQTPRLRGALVSYFVAPLAGHGTTQTDG
jgi:hypothetical protein